MELGTYYSTVNKQEVIFTDIAAGVVFNKRLYFSVGMSFLNNDVISQQTIYNSSGSYDVNTQLKLHLFIINGEYVFFKSYPWVVSIVPIKIGIGNPYYEYVDPVEKERTQFNEHTVLTYNPQFYSSYNLGTLGNWKFLKWIGISGSVGYRFVAFSSKEIQEDLNSYTFSIGLKFYLDKIYDDVFPNGMFPKKEKDDEKK